MKKPSAFKFIFFLVILIQMLAHSQRRSTVASPEINSDGSVTFRYDGPKAKTVELSGEFLKEKISLVRGDTGVWSLTVNSIDPDIYPYFFVVDGVNIADPSNPDIFPNERFKRSLVDVPSQIPGAQDIQDVPHGLVTLRYYQSKSLGLTRQLVVYTPPGYETNSTTKYPVLYLIHGMTDTEDTWVNVGKVNLILDNLIAQGKAKPMIIVMPYANPYPALLKKDKSTKVDLLSTDMFIREIMNEIIPITEKNYRVNANAEGRAIAGFSLGGRQTLAAGLANPKTFSYVCAFAPAVWKREFDQSFTNLYKPTADLNANLKMLSVCVGKTDFLYQPALDLLAAFEEKKIKHTKHFSEGGHTWMNVRDYVEKTVQELFK
jgi:enterochelin esterase-like enzyme